MDARSVRTKLARQLLVGLAALALVGGAVACGGDGDDAAADQATTTTAADTGGTEPAPAPGGGGAAEVSTASTDLGDVLVDGDGYTLYIFKPDNQSDPTCVDACLEAWPPLLSDGDPTTGDGVDEALIGTVGVDGSDQVTYDGWPLYRFAGDTGAGETTGQGSGGVWFVVGPDGQPIEDGADASDGY